MSITILYGSETGNAQDYAELLYKRLQYASLTPTLSSLDDYPLKKLITHTTILIIICSTTGQGELPRNSKNFMKFILKKKLPDDFLNHISLTLFGVGDSLYPKFNYAIKKIHTRLTQLGCNELCGRSEADEQSSEGIDGFYTEWESSVMQALREKFPDNVPLPEDVLLPAEHEVSIDRESADIPVGYLIVEEESDLLYSGTVVKNERLTSADHFQDVRHISIQTDETLNYSPGDTLSLYPINDDHSVELLIELQPTWKLIADKPLTISNLESIGSIFPNGSPVKQLTLRLLIKYHLDIMSIPRRSFFMTLWHFVDGDANEFAAREKEKLHEFSSFEEPEDLYDYANRPRRLILETLLEFEKNLTIPIEFIFDLFPKIKPRLFLIALKPSQNIVEIVVAIVEYKTMLRRIRRGLCTKWLKTKEVGSKIQFSIHKSNLNFEQLTPLQTPAPILMISPGTGVAPMKSLIEFEISKSTTTDLALFFGCRFSEKDHIFGKEWEELEKFGKLKYFPCFSRDTNSKCKYVQDKLIEQAQFVSDYILNKHAMVFICGSSGAMPRQVRMTLIEILKKVGKLSQEDAEKYLIEMEINKRYIQETW